MTKLCLWTDKQNDVSQSEYTLHPKLNYEISIEIPNKKNILTKTSEHTPNE